MSREDRIEAIKWNVEQCEDKIRDLEAQRGKYTSYTHSNGEVEEFDTTGGYDKYIIDAQIKDLRREIQLDLSRLSSLKREVEAYV